MRVKYTDQLTSFYIFFITSLFNIHSLHDTHGIMNIKYKQFIEVNIEANNA